MDTLRGSLLMVLAMATFALEDMFIKSAARDIPVGEILILFGLGGMVIFAAMARAQGHAPWHPGFGTRRCCCGLWQRSQDACVTRWRLR